MPTQRQPRYKPGDKIGGRFEVHKALMGGMGEVYLCLDLETIQPYALKTFQQHYTTSALRDAFFEEVGAWVALEKHENIVRCFYMETIDNQPFAFLEWIASDESRGTDLRSWLRRGPLDLRLALDFTIDICRGLRYAQSKAPGIVHRDLKPDNVLVNQSRIAKITDFGLAMVVQQATLTPDGESELDLRQSLTGAGGIVGTPLYMPPEQWRSEVVDERADIYAVGCILYEMLTGSWLYNGTSLDALRRQHIEAPIPRLPDYPELSPILERCLAKARRDRFNSVDALLKTLEQFYHTQIEQTPREEKADETFGATDYNNRGLTYAALGQYKKALADFDQAIDLDSQYASAYYNRGLTYDDIGRCEEALTDYAQAIQLDPQNAQACSNRGLTYHDIGWYKDALADYDRAIAIDPQDALAYNNRGNTYCALGRYAEALAGYNRAIAIDPQFAPAYYNRGVTYNAMGRYDEALADYAKAICLDPQYANAYNNTGALLGNQGKEVEALPYFEKAAHLGHERAAQYTAQVRQKLGMPPKS